MERTDEQLITDYLSGDEKSLKVLIDRYLKPIYNFVYQLVGNASETEDITQEVFVKAWQHLKKFNPQRSHLANLWPKQKKSFKPYLFAIAKNTAFDFFRKKKIIPFSALEKIDDEEEKVSFEETLIDSAPLPPEIFDRENLSSELAAIMDKLSPQSRAVLFLYYNEHLTFQEIAEILKEPLDTVKSRHRRALIKLRELLIKNKVDSMS